MIDVVLVGYGPMGHRHARALASHPNLRLAAVVDPLVSPTATVPCFASIADADAISYDAAIVAAPAARHVELGDQLIRRGKHVLMEKPVAPTAAEALELAQVARRHDVHLVAGYVERWNPGVIAIRQRLAQVQNLYRLRFERTGNYAAPPAKDVLLELAIHDVDLLQQLTGISHLVAASRVVDRANQTQATYMQVQTHRFGVTAEISARWQAPTKQRLVHITDRFGTTTHDLLASGQASDPLLAQLDAFDSLLQTGEPSGLCVGEEVALALSILQAAQASSPRWPAYASAVASIPVRTTAGTPGE